MPSKPLAPIAQSTIHAQSATVAERTRPIARMLAQPSAAKRAGQFFERLRHGGDRIISFGGGADEPGADDHSVRPGVHGRRRLAAVSDSEADGHRDAG